VYKAWGPERNTQDTRHKLCPAFNQNYTQKFQPLSCRISPSSQTQPSPPAPSFNQISYPFLHSKLHRNFWCDINIEKNTLYQKIWKNKIEETIG
jgi:hypothetical protein